VNRYRGEQGFSLFELVVSMVVFSTMLAAFFIFYRSQALALSNQERFLNAKQNAQIGMDFVVRELRTAGARPLPEAYPNPGCVSGPCCTVAKTTSTICFGQNNNGGGYPSLVSASGTSLRLLADYRGDALGDAPDGCPNDPGEDITYTYDSGTGRLMRAPGSDAATPVLEGIATDSFRFRYYGYGNGTPPPFVEFQSGGGALTANEIARLTHIAITVTTTAPSRVGSSAVVSTQTSTVDIRNPAC
jgi:prepilin-type N-terminal cleavage/methylation domain-containing protein